MLNHIGIEINDENEIKNFYIDILGFTLEYDFVLRSNLSKDIFGIEKDTRVFMLKKDNFYMELFLTENSKKTIYNHICLDCEDKKSLLTHIKNKGYKYFYQERENKPALLFIYDNFGNIYEIKDKV